MGTTFSVSGRNLIVAEPCFSDFSICEYSSSRKAFSDICSAPFVVIAEVAEVSRGP